MKRRSARIASRAVASNAVATAARSRGRRARRGEAQRASEGSAIVVGVGSLKEAFEGGRETECIVVNDGTGDYELQRNEYYYIANAQVRNGRRGTGQRMTQYWVCRLVDWREEVGEQEADEEDEVMLGISPPPDCNTDKILLLVQWLARATDLTAGNTLQSHARTRIGTGLLATEYEMVVTNKRDYIWASSVFGVADVVEVEPQETMSAKHREEKWKVVKLPKKICGESCEQGGMYEATKDVLRYCEECEVWRHVECLGEGIWDDEVRFEDRKKVPGALVEEKNTEYTELGERWAKILRTPIQRTPGDSYRPGPMSFEIILLAARAEQREHEGTWRPREDTEGAAWLEDKLKGWTLCSEEAEELKAVILDEFDCAVDSESKVWYVCPDCQRVM